MKKFLLFGIFFLLLSNKIFCLKIDRVIFGSDINPNYIQFWPIVAKVWKELLGVKPTLALISSTKIDIDESLGDVIRFDPIPGIPTSLQAQTIRLLLPSFFPNDTCIISDMDLFPLQKKYFTQSVKNIPDNSFVIFRDKAYGENVLHFPMCYIAAKGKTYQEIFGGGTYDEIINTIIRWSHLKYGWHTDEKVLTEYVTNWKDAKTRVIKLGHRVQKRVDREDMYFHYDRLAQGDYIDCHAPRPYSQYKDWVDTLIKIMKDGKPQLQLSDKTDPSNQKSTTLPKNKIKGKKKKKKKRENIRNNPLRIS